MGLKRGCRGVWIVPLLLAADRITKMAAVALNGEKVLIPGVVNARYVRNMGIAFSMFSGGGAGIVLLTVLMIAAILAWLLIRPDEPRLFRTGLWLIAAGGLGNLYDRVAYGYVIDFIETVFVRFAVFNIADVSICTGAGLAILALFMEELGSKNRPKGNEHAD